MKVNKASKSQSNKWVKSVVAPAVAVGLLMNTVVPTTVAASSATYEQKSEEVLVAYKNEKGLEMILEKATKVKSMLKNIKAVTVELDARTIREFNRNENIRYIQSKESVDLLGSPAQWNVEDVNAPEAWAEGYTGEGVKVAVIDSGVDNHDDLNVVGKYSFVEDDPNTTNVDESSPMDHDGHGTHVSGIIGAKLGVRDVMGADVVGVSHGVDLYSLKVKDNNVGSLIDVVEAIDWSIENDMDIINLSLGTTTPSPMLEEAVNKAYEAGIILVASSGNDGVGTQVNYPAKYDSVMAVSSIDKQENISDFSSTGSEIEFTAPGSDEEGYHIISTHLVGQGYTGMGGTSQAAPHVAGFMALLKQKNPAMSNVELRDELQNYVKDLGPEGRDSKFGYGKIDYLAYEGTDTEAPSEVTDFVVEEALETEATVSWVNPTDSDFEQVVVYKDGVKEVETTDESYTFEGLEAGETFDVKIETVDVEGNVSEGSTFKVTAGDDVTAPSEVSGLEVTNKGTDSLTVGYQVPEEDDFDKVNVYVDGQLDGTATVGSYTVEGLNDDTDYQVEVRTVDEEGNESNGVMVEGKTDKEIDKTAPSELSDVSVDAKDHESFDLSYTLPNDADFDKVNVYINGSLLGSIKENTVTIDGLSGNTSYDVELKTVDVTGNESVGKSLTVVTDEVPDNEAPSEVSNVSVMDKTDSGFKVRFDNPSESDFDKVNVYVDGQLDGSTMNEEYEFTGLQDNQEYTVVMKTVDAKGNESNGVTEVVKTEETPDTVAPSEVSNVSITDKSDREFKVTFNNPSEQDFDTVNVYVDGELKDSVSNGSYVVTGLNEKTSYEVVLKTVDTTGNESNGVSKSVVTEETPDVDAPDEVSGMVVDEKGETFVTVGFNNPSDVDFNQANVYVNGEFEGSTSNGSYKIESLEENTSYDVVVKTEDQDGNESVGSALTVKTEKAPDVTAPGEATGVKVAEVTDETMKVTYGLPSDEDFDKVNVYVDGELDGSTSATVYEVKNLEEKTSYDVVVKTVDVNGNESVGVEVQGTTVETPDVEAPDNVKELEIGSIGENDADVTWVNPENDDLAKVKVYVNGSEVEVFENGEETYSLKDLTENTTYTVKVTAVDEDGNESDGVEKEFTTKEVVEEVVEEEEKEEEKEEEVVEEEEKEEEKEEVVEEEEKEEVVEKEEKTYKERLQRTVKFIEQKPLNEIYLWDIATIEAAGDMASDEVKTRMEMFKNKIGLKEFNSGKGKASELKVHKKKDINFRFNTKIDYSSVKEVFLMKDGELMTYVDVELNDNGKTVTILAPEDGYEEGSYALFLGTELSSENGTQMKNPLVVKFEVK